MNLLLTLLLASVPASAAPKALAPTPEARAVEALFYSDMGPDRIDVSSYPPEQRANYAVYARACSRCHTLARSVNAPVVSREWWEFYLMSMRLRSKNAGRPLSSSETKAILDFLDYDSQARKVEKAREFNALLQELILRFDAAVAERVKRAPSMFPPSGR